jgi:copper chaperone CopZ
MGATKDVLVDLKKKTVAVEAKDGQTLDAKAISAEIVDAGYDVVKIEPVSQSVAEIRAELKGQR